jgi:glutaredoxin-like protein DUF836
MPPAEGGGAARLVLYGRPYCHLCDEMLAELRALDRTLAVEIVDVDGDPALEARFGEHVPVLMHGELELSRHRLDPERVRAYLGRTG